MRIFALLMLIVSVVPVRAGDVSVAVSLSRNKIGVEDQATMTVRVTSKVKNVPDPQLPKVAGLSFYGAGTSSSYQMGTGGFSMTKTLTYSVVPAKTGSFTIPAVKVTVKNKTYGSKPLKLTVVKGSVQPKNSARRGGQQRLAQPQGQGRDIFVRAVVDRASAFINQQVTLTYELYTNINLRGVSFKKYPKMTGCWAEDLEVPDKKSQTMVNIKGQRYLKVILKKAALFPLTSGTLKIDPAEVVVNYTEANRRDPFASFFSSGFGRTRQLQVNSKPVSIMVKPLPAAGKPAGFAGSIGRYKVSSSLDKTAVKAGDPVTLTVKIAGSGNIKTIAEPVLDIKGDFERYDSGSDVKIFNRNYLVQGSKTFKYVFIPKSAGTHQVGGIVFSHFDPRKGKYISKTTALHTITAAPGEKKETGQVVISGLTRENIKMLDRDITFIKTPADELRNYRNPWYGRWWFLLLQLVPVMAVAAVFLYQRQSEILAKDVGKARSLRAHRMARKRLQSARKLMGGKDPGPYLGAVSKAVTDYLGDKLNIAATGATTLRISELLEDKEVDAAAVAECRRILEFCDFGRFAPSGISPEDLAKVLKDAEEMMVGMEKEHLA